MICKNILNNYNIILASQSPRRRELINGLGIEVTIAEAYNVDEIVEGEIETDMVAEFLSLKKSEEYLFELSPNDILITSDTVVCVDGEVLGKPVDKNDAVRMLSKLSNKDHKVITAVTLRNADFVYSFSETTKVKFKKITSEDIEYYIENYKPYDKAGAYAIQEWIGYVAIETITGSFYNVMGLPVCRLYQELEEFINKIKINLSK